MLIIGRGKNVIPRDREGEGLATVPVAIGKGGDKCRWKRPLSMTG
jgi:hypothetical protein